ncbi:hypothetical protein GLAREA_01145 [Glarea lozoyensis ATCC 20868]|uniref:Heterokaryon incompatibility domain-containing protein n=1 Tax=Glarea lozoyensis (strain ATCC 20868 / MF5171) TaxID=1116229 RepID=S3CWG3_GLAL2|nr:uncharacterized protein GLAREA_01145 [Glarea lozoyensis ATCC 20868]EPE29985.1 hypothetical protein GLAREA_01145 [Glarea lozoyensis ATCC 20868]
MTWKLCARCSPLGLNVEHFRVQGDTLSATRLSIQSLKLANERYFLGSLEEISRETEATCQLCALISHAVPDLKSSHTKHAACYLVWELDGRTSVDIGAKAERRTRRLRIFWDHPDLQRYNSSLVLTAPAIYDNSDVDYRGLLSKETEFLGRRLGSKESKRNLIRELLRLCERHHDDRCTSKLGIEDDFHETLMEPYFGVMDIENDNLTPLPFKENGNQLNFESYATVSYVWGRSGNHQHSTKIANIQSRRKSGGLASVIKTLPKALQQSIRLIRELGIRYIWIDALCIVQDSSHSWNLNARAMHLIYGNAIFTLCAADGLDVKTGLLALDENHQPAQWFAASVQGANLMLHQSPEVNIEASQWNKRAWTFQERLLSKRCLIFTSGRVYFQCRSTGMSEDIFADRSGRGWSLDLLRSPLQMLSQLKLRALWFYAHCVSLYTGRDLSEPFDILSAFSGMCKLMEYTMHSPFIFGLPTSHFDFALLWQPVGRSSRLIKPTHSNEQKYKDMKFPSWSWCGWESTGIQYAREMVDGCLTDVHAWLMDHTWIDWYIRDGHGTLRRVWDSSWAKEDESTNARWKGYEVQSKKTPTSGIPKARPRLRQRHPQPYSNTVPMPYNPTPAAREQTNTVTTPFSHYPQVQGEGRGFPMGNPFNPSHQVVHYPPSDSDSSSSTPSGNDDLKSKEQAYDSYGRPRQGLGMSASLNQTRDDFTLTLPEDPYHVRKSSKGGDAHPGREFSDQIFLQFFTWHARFHVVPTTPDVSSDGLGQGQHRCHIIDQRGDKCGSIVVDTDWLQRQQSCEVRENGTTNGHLDETEKTEKTEFEFIAISEAKSFTKEEFPDWTYYIPEERIDSEWDLFYVLLVEYSEIEGFYRRVALGKIFKAAFDLSDDEWKEIILG